MSSITIMSIESCNGRIPSIFFKWNILCSLQEYSVPLPCKCCNISTKVNENFYGTINCILDRQYKFQHVFRTHACSHMCAQTRTHARTHTHTHTHTKSGINKKSGNLHILTKCKHYIIHVDLKILHTFSKSSVTRLTNSCLRIIHVFQTRLKAAALWAKDL